MDFYSTPVRQEDYIKPILMESKYIFFYINYEKKCPYKFFANNYHIMVQ